MQINPQTIIDRGILIPCKYTQVQQVGIDLTINEDISLCPGESKNVTFNEQINLPDDIFSITNIRSSYSRKGVFTTSGIYDPMFSGTMGCTIYNLGNEEIKILKNIRILQMIFFEADAASQYDGHYNHTDSVESKIN